MINPPSLAPLEPQTHPLANGNVLYFFPNPSLQMVKLDLTFEAGSGHQSLMSQAHAANQLIGEATQHHTAQQVAEFLDFRGIVLERFADVCQGNLSVYFLRKYAAELFPLLREMLVSPLVTPQLFDAYLGRRRQQVALALQQTSHLARNRFYEILYGPTHPMGRYATPDDVDRLTLDDVVDFQRQHYRLAHAHLVMAGPVGPDLLALADQFLAPDPEDASAHPHLTLPPPCPAALPTRATLPTAVQTTLRIGRLLPMAWDSPDYASFMVLSTVLGGYFGSRLMSNIREDKGYTYGIYAQTQIFRGSIVFYITADVASQVADQAVAEVYSEVQRLQRQPVPQEELERVKNVMMGDFIRSIDGTFEIAERYRQMASTHVTEQFTRNYLHAVQHATPATLQALAQQYLTHLTCVTAGPAD